MNVMVLLAEGKSTCTFTEIKRIPATIEPKKKINESYLFSFVQIMAENSAKQFLITAFYVISMVPCV
jgi:hypothetical protein